MNGPNGENGASAVYLVVHLDQGSKPVVVTWLFQLIMEAENVLARPLKTSSVLIRDPTEHINHHQPKLEPFTTVQVLVTLYINKQEDV